MDPKMAIFLLASFLLLSTSSAVETPHIAPAPALAPHIAVDRHKECPGLCEVRCGAHSRPNVCNRACNSCCLECGCVPPGTYGHKELCGKCYAERLTHRNETKCP